MNGSLFSKIIQFPSTTNYELKKLDLSDTIAGYPCKAISLENQEEMHIIYYNETIKVSAHEKLKVLRGSMFEFLEATNGAFPLSVITSSSRKYFRVKEATSVIHKELSDEEFSISTKK
jgi:hypothetical protein